MALDDNNRRGRPFLVILRNKIFMQGIHRSSVCQTRVNQHLAVKVEGSHLSVYSQKPNKITILHGAEMLTLSLTIIDEEYTHCGASWSISTVSFRRRTETTSDSASKPKSFGAGPLSWGCPFTSIGYFWRIRSG